MVNPTTKVRRCLPNQFKRSLAPSTRCHRAYKCTAVLRMLILSNGLKFACASTPSTVDSILFWVCAATCSYFWNSTYPIRWSSTPWRFSVQSNTQLWHFTFHPFMYMIPGKFVSISTRPFWMRPSYIVSKLLNTFWFILYKYCPSNSDIQLRSLSSAISNMVRPPILQRNIRNLLILFPIRCRSSYPFVRK